jgi:hypothetical protein
MKKLVNLVAYSFLAFSLYLNFVYKGDVPEAPAQASTASHNAVAVNSPEQFNDAKETVPAGGGTEEKSVTPAINKSNAPLKLSSIQ